MKHALLETCLSNNMIMYVISNLLISQGDDPQILIHNYDIKGSGSMIKSHDEQVPKEMLPIANLSRVFLIYP